MSELIGGYRLGELSGSGATASVFAAEDAQTGERVALKVLHPHLSEREVDRERFLAGAQHRVAHPNVIGIRGAGEQISGTTTVCWIALDWAEGEPLARRLRRGALAPAEVRELADGLLRALAAVHDSGLVHRDVSTSNVLVPARALVRAADVRLIDVDRLAWTGEASLGDDALGPDPSADGALRVVANPDFAAPEQRAGLPLDRRGDLFSAAAVIYAAATGHPPYRAGRRDALLSGGVVTPPIASVDGADVPVEVDRALAAALSPVPLRRPRDAEELRRRIVEALAGAGAVADDAVDAEAAGAAGAGGGTGGIAAAQPDAVTRVLGATGAGISGPRASASPSDHTARDAVTAVIPPRAARASGARAAAPAPVGPAVRPAADPAAAPDDDARDRPLRGRGGLIALVAVVLALAGIATLPALAGTEAEPQERTTATASPSAAPSTSATPTVPSRPSTAAPPADTALPELVGLGLGEATSRLAAIGVEVGIVSEVDSASPASTVVRAPTSVPAGSRVDLVVASGRNVVPDVAGLTIADGRARLSAAGFGVAGASDDDEAGTAPGASATASRITGTSPIAGTSLPIGTVVELRATRIPASPSPSASPSATSTPRPSASPSAARGPS
ncbi:serine/threonine-protein kinase [Schumannella sp. 10F1B-5-1]|uniref:serine/threonine-protein kinase n=1 Tax=Schumannella sp. 10F1B-5-1 TaxID=2590780 RepID=UPI001130820D|nr:serine/threonine-protein kinase [Schumannella sp. 10F1B-5-1]TPW73636.1 PASTA domain-containing protein [Schumannella sp. 10F1B-5-1]